MMNKKTIKEFLKPTWKNILLLVIFVILSTFITYHGTDCLAMGGGCSHIHGFPCAIDSIYYSAIGPHGPYQPPRTSYTPISIIPNIIFWYLISCIIIFACAKFRKIK